MLRRQFLGATGLGTGLDILILNAGTGSFTDFGLVNGVEKIFVVN